VTAARQGAGSGIDAPPERLDADGALLSAGAQLDDQRIESRRTLLEKIGEVPPPAHGAKARYPAAVP
jgi:hypothetical protein